MGYTTLKTETLQRKLNYINRNILRISKGDHNPALIAETTDAIEWLWRFRHISESQKDELCDKVIVVLED